GIRDTISVRLRHRTGRIFIVCDLARYHFGSHSFLRMQESHNTGMTVWATVFTPTFVSCFIKILKKMIIS
ncbi:MAG: hypothetical protein SVZ03_12205, partial [Spirochaetota bacterium]|nr:hypothetical protein [Spirochaetota bacterium]